MYFCALWTHSFLYGCQVVPASLCYSHHSIPLCFSPYFSLLAPVSDNRIVKEPEHWPTRQASGQVWRLYIWLLFWIQVLIVCVWNVCYNQWEFSAWDQTAIWPWGHKEDSLTLLSTIYADKEPPCLISKHKPVLCSIFPKATITSRSRNLNDPDN